MELFEKLKKDNEIWDAQIVGKNVFCQNMGNTNCFLDYFTFCINNAELPVEVETRIFFVKEAELALDVFSEKCIIDILSLNVIRDSRKKLVSTTNIINKLMQEQKDEQNAIAFDNNNSVLAELSKLKSEMIKVTEQIQFDTVLEKMSNLEERLDKAIMTPNQTKLYDSLTRDYSVLVSRKMEEISHTEDVCYNKKAAESFKKAFELFKGNEEKYKKSDRELYGLVSSFLFAYDSKRLFNECLVYYNHVYSYIFNKLDDDGKFRFTQFSFDTPKEK